MQFENVVLNLKNVKVESRGNIRFVKGGKNQSEVPLTDEQIFYLDRLIQGETIHQVVKNSVAQGHTVSFLCLFGLIESLVKAEIITDNQIKEYFVQKESTSESIRLAPNVGKNKVGKWEKSSIEKLPFFRNLKPEVLDIFISSCELIEAQERSLVIKAGEVSRDMFVLLEGEASIYKVDELKRRRLITIIPAGSIFGEGAFLLDKPRAADVITNVPCVIARIVYNDKKFSSVIKATKTDYLQERIWVLHGLLSSPMFHNLPADSLDRFIIKGKVRKVADGEIMCVQAKLGRSFFVIIQGEMTVIRNQQIIKTLKQGDVFGEIAVMINNGERVATVKAATDGLVLEVTREELIEVLAENLVLAKEIEFLAQKRYNDLF